MAPRTDIIPLRLPAMWRISTRISGFLNEIKDTRPLNCYVEKRVDNEDVDVCKRPCVFTGSGFTLPTGALAGTFHWENAENSSGGDERLVLVSNTHVTVLAKAGTVYAYLLNDGALTSSASGNTVAYGTELPSDTASAGKFAFTLADYLYYVDAATYTCTKVTDADYPGLLGRGMACGIELLDGTTYVMTHKYPEIFGSDVDDVTAWDPLNVIQATDDNDNGQYLARQGPYLVAMLSRSIRAFYSNPSPSGSGSTLLPVAGVRLPYGCFDGKSVQNVDGTLVWVTRTKKAGLQIARMDDLNMRIISTPDIDRLLMPFAGNGSTYPTQGGWMRSFQFQIAGHPFYVLNMYITDTVIKGLTLVYDLVSGEWAIWTGPDGFEQWPYHFAAKDPYSGDNLLFRISVGGSSQLYGIAYEAVNVGEDDGELIPMTLYTPQYTGGTPFIKVLSKMWIEGDVVVDGRLSVSWTDDDYQTWSIPIEISLDQPMPMLDNLGSFYRRAFKLTYLGPKGYRIRALHLLLDVGSA